MVGGHHQVRPDVTQLAVQTMQCTVGLVDDRTNVRQRLLVLRRSTHVLRTLLTTQYLRQFYAAFKTRSSAIAEGPRDASCQLKSCQLPRNSAETTCTTSHTHTHTHLTALFPGLPGWAGTRKVQPIWILLKQETASGSGISWAYASLHLAPDR